jgi:hypothetical protein
LTELNKPDQFFLALVKIDYGQAEGVAYISGNHLDVNPIST